MNVVVKRSEYQGKISVPASKSDAQRALLCAALAGENSIVCDAGKSADVLNLLMALKCLGAEITIEQNEIIFKKAIQRPYHGCINIGESGLACRLMTAVLAVEAQDLKITGEGTLNSRKIDVYENLLPQLKVDFQSTGGKLPLQLNGTLEGGSMLVDGSFGSQYISGLLMALPQCKEDSVLKVQDQKSRPYVLMTIKTLAEFGVNISLDKEDIFRITGNQNYRSTRYQVEGDWSSASYWLVAAALGLNIEISGLAWDSLQADKMMLNALLAAGCKIQNVDSSIKVHGKQRHPFQFDASHCPDLFPALATLAALTPGTSRIKGVNRLYNKESDRANALLTEFSKLGVLIQIEEDEMVIEGQEQLKGATISTYGDHRIAMCIAIAGMFNDEGIEIANPEVVNKSYPEFWGDLKSLKEKFS
jgi:3-phosphoshikimate 1-carboxyvinyltransferase